MGNYTSYLEPKTHSVSKPINRKNMVKNNAGGYVFKSDDFKVINQWLMTGSIGNTFYQSNEELTSENIELIEKLIITNPVRIAEMIVYASKKGVNNHTPILALVYLSMGSFKAKKQFRLIFNEVIRTASHLYEFMNYTKSLRGFGKTIHKAILSWIREKSISDLEYQFLKYQQREGWSGRDVLRMVKPVPRNEIESLLFSWMVGKTKEMSLTEFKDKLNRIGVYEFLKIGDIKEDRVIELINKYNLTHEMIPANITRTKNIWGALFHKMPITATIKNLGNLTEKGIFDKIENIDILEERLSKENLKKGMIHPIVLASAYKIYKSDGNIGRSKLTWDSISRINDILEEAINNSFENVEPTGKSFFHALDISGSMTGGEVGNLWLAPAEISAIMTLATIKTEKNYFIGGFSYNFIPLKNFTKTKDFSYCMIPESYWSAPPYAEGNDFGSTNAGSALEYAIKNGIYTDVFVFWTDSENWVGKHTSQLFEDYKKAINPDAKIIYITLVPNKYSLTNPTDKNSYDIRGFSADTIKIINMITRNEI